MSPAQDAPLFPPRTRPTDDPAVVAEQRAEDYSNHMVPLTARVGRWQLTMSYWSLLSAMVWLFYGAPAASLYGTVDALIAIGISVATYSLINALFARWGRRSGLNNRRGPSDPRPCRNDPDRGVTGPHQQPQPLPASANWGRLITHLIGVRLSRTVLVVLTSAVVFLLMLTDVFSYPQSALTWQGVFLVSWVGIALTHYALVPQDRAAGPEFRALRLPRVTWGLGVWLLASAVGIHLAEAPGVPTPPAGTAQLVALVVSAVLYAVVVKLRPVAESTAAGPRGEVDDPAATWAECHRCMKAYVVLEMDREPASGSTPVCDACATTSLVPGRS
ncbi:hypothetical protein [Streptomyces sp. S465]|uniref:hypothetical protein n=1 Tax=Streptomyces sp. S465 TaxID=2979468 RepID=UPI0022A8BA91|nr:hypothetical protein [Streptomyces sp. S465]WAP54774.1 hypothetical protein N6H00_07115 [Streptomyces sp. S465]